MMSASGARGARHGATRHGATGHRAVVQRAVVVAIAVVALASAAALAAAGAPSSGLTPPAGRPAVAAIPGPGHPDLRVALSRSLAAAGEATSNISSSGSLNWAGFAMTRRAVTFRSVRATFFVPYLNCAASPGKTLSSSWAGMDGYSGKSTSVEQIGIAANCSASGTASYLGWFEMFPYAEARLPVKIHPGDSVTAEVTYSAAHGDFRLTLIDTTRGEHVTRVRRCPDVRVSGTTVTCPRTSAEVIAEAPEIGTGKQLSISPLSDYGAISFTGIRLTDSAGQAGGIVSSHWSATKIIQLGGSTGPVLVQPTPLSGGRFDDYWLRED